MKKIRVSLLLFTLTVSSCSFPIPGGGGKINTYNNIYVLKDGYTKDDLQGGPVWMNSNIAGDVAKIEKPKITDDFYAHVNYDDLINNNPGFFETAKNNTVHNLVQLVSKEDFVSKNDDILSAAASRTYEGEPEAIRNRLTDMMNNGIEDFLFSKEALGNNSGSFYLSPYENNDNGVSITHRTTDGSIQYRSIGYFTYTISYYNWVYDYYGEQYIEYKNYADWYELIIRNVLEELYKGAGFTDKDLYLSYIDKGIQGEASLFESYKNSMFGNDPLVHFSLAGSAQYSSYLKQYFTRNQTYLGSIVNSTFYTYQHDLDAINYIYNHKDEDEIKAMMINRALFDYRFMLGFEGYRYAGYMLAEQQATNDFRYTNESKYENISAWQTYGLIHDVVDNSYINSYCDEEKVTRVTNLITDIRNEYKNILQNNDWLTSTTKAKAVEKLEAMKAYVSYPKSLKSEYPEITRSTYSSLFDVYEAYIDNKIEIVKNRKFVGNDGGFSHCTMLTVNAYNSFQDNSIVILQGLMEGDIFGDKSKEGELAMIGMIIGHEISHAFDTNGADYDKNGNYKNWWTAGDKANFQLKVNKITRYFNSIELINGVYADGKRENGEACSDMGGVKVALCLAKKEANFDYDSFFRQYAKLWLFSCSLNDMSAYIDDEHPLDYLRVNVTVAQFDEFVETYNLKEGDAMYVSKNDRIAVW